MDHRQVGWDTVAAGLAISVVTYIHIPRISPPVTALTLGAAASIFMEPGFGFGPEIFFYLMLPPIILRSGIDFNAKQLNGVWKTTFLYSIMGTVFSAVIIFMGCFTMTELGFTKCSHLGSVLSSTDPVATIASIKHAGVSEAIQHALQNEALTNDAVAAMLTHASEKQTISASNTVLDIIIGILSSLSIGSVGGYIFGGFKNPITVLGMATTLYAVCELMNASGILCIFVFAITSKWRKTPQDLKIFIDIVADLCDIYTMFCVGTEIAFIGKNDFYISAILFLSCLAARILFATAFGIISRENWDFDDLMFMGCMGSRGTLSYALARSISNDLGPIVLCVVLLSTIFSILNTFIFNKIRS